jgi:predicted SAM-dependent methyltransferase
MTAYEMDLDAAEDTFDEEAYLLANPDVADAVRSGQLASGRQHFDRHGRHEQPGRRMRMSSRIRDAKQAKLARILPLLRRDVAALRQETFIDCLPANVRRRWNIVDTSAVSRHGYGDAIKTIIARHAGGLILDVGAGCRPVYHDNVVNYEIVPYDTTDVLGVAEELPFRDGVFDAVVSVAVLEHVKDPFRCAAEMVRVLKPGGDLYCEVPLLQPVHGYPHHYYNMTHQGLRNLFEGRLVVDRVWVPAHMHPVWALTWILGSWSKGLEEATRARFLELTVRDLMQDPAACGDLDFVAGLSEAAQTELACGNAISGRKPSS